MTNTFRFRALAQVDRVYDGDTWFGRHRPDPSFVVESDFARYVDGSDRAGQYYRLAKVDTHELNASSEERRRMASEERNFTIDWIRAGRQAFDGDWPFIIEYEGDEFRGSFGRRLVDLVRRSDYAELNDSLLQAFPDRDLRY